MSQACEAFLKFCLHICAHNDTHELQEEFHMKNVKIEVVKITFDEELAEQYLTDGKEAGACPYFHLNNCFFYEGNAKMPEGFCPWAWVDIYHHVNAIANGATYAPWFKKDGQNVMCCTDGIRAVSFLIEAK